MEMTYRGLRVEYLEEGQGPLVVLLHGWGSNKELYQSLIHTLSVKYRVAAPDIPGFGKSEEPKEPWCVDDYCDFTEVFVEELLKQNSSQEVILAGHSHGGRILIKLLGGRKLSFRVSKLILIDSAGLVPEKTPEQLRKIKRYKQGKKILGLAPVKFLFPHALEKFQSRSGSEDYRQASPVMRQSMVKVVNEDVRAYLGRISSETLLVWGDKDTATPLSDGQYMEKRIPGAGLAVLPGAGHYSFLDNQYQFLAVMKSFLNV